MKRICSFAVLAVWMFLLMVPPVSRAETASFEEQCAFIQQRMAYRSIADLLDGREPIADLITTPDAAHAFADYQVTVAEVVSDGCQTYVNLLIEMTQPGAFALPMACAEEDNLFYIPPTLYPQPVYFFSLAILDAQGQEHPMATAFALNDDLRRLELVCSHASALDPAEFPAAPVGSEIRFVLHAARYETGGFSPEAQPLPVECSIQPTLCAFRYAPTEQVAAKARNLGLEPPTFAVLLMPFQLYAPGLSLHASGAEQVVAVPCISPDGRSYLWALADSDGQLYADGKPYASLPDDLRLCLIDATETPMVLGTWPVAEGLSPQEP